MTNRQKGQIRVGRSTGGSPKPHLKERHSTIISKVEGPIKQEQTKQEPEIISKIEDPTKQETKQEPEIISKIEDPTKQEQTKQEPEIISKIEDPTKQEQAKQEPEIISKIEDPTKQEPEIISNIENPTKQEHAKWERIRQELEIISKREDSMGKKSKKKHSKEKKQKTIRSVNKIDKFNLLIEDNKASDRPWYYGLKGDWWWGMTEDQARARLIEVESAFEKNSKIAIASIVRNEESNGNLKRFLNCCHKLEKYYKNIVYIFVEGDSSDNTYEVLKNWLTPRKDYILKKVDRRHHPFAKNRDTKRTIYFAELRNMLIDLALSIPEVSEVLMIDANYGWKGDLISSLRDADADIVAPLAVMHKGHNGKYLFYDTWAFRKDGRQFSQVYPYTKGLGHSPLDVDSAGGGYLVNRRVLEAGVRYNGNRDCEHVGFCQMARDVGFTIKINPRIYIRKGGHEE